MELRVENSENMQSKDLDVDIKTHKLALTVKEAAELLSTSVSSVYNLIHVEGFPVIRVGAGQTKVIIPTEPLKDWLKKAAYER